MFIRLWRDERGTILPYVTMMLVVFIGMGALALDGGRYMSLQSQMQSVADALAIAGARELDQRSGARDRATSAINTLVSNGLNGLGYSGTITHAAPVFYNALPAANTGFTGTPATSDLDAKFVAVTVNPVTLPTLMPIRFFQAAGTNSFSAGAQAIAGFTGRAICDMPPVFICNPYETSGMTDTQATAALRSAFDDSNTHKRMLRMTMDSTTPGHFGYLVPPDGCNGASCLTDWIAKTHPRTCYQTSTVDLNTGNKSAVSAGFNVRFDMYKGSLNYSADYAPDVNVRKGYVPGGGGNWCNANPGSPYYTTQPAYTDPIVNTTGNTQNGNTTQRKTVLGVPSADIAKINNPTSGGGRMISDPSNVKIPIGTNVSTASGTSIVMDAASNNPAATGVILTAKWKTSGFPQDKNWTGICDSGTCLEGDGNWDCANYWRLNHSTAPDADCTASPPQVSRYDIYKREIANNLVNDWSGNGLANTGGATQGNGESGAPYCAGTGNGVANRRIIYAAIINCLAHNDLITGGSTANNIPVADFGKFFMTQPVNTTVNDGVLYGEMTGAIGSLDRVRIMNQVQLYR